MPQDRRAWEEGSPAGRALWVVAGFLVVQGSAGCFSPLFEDLGQYQYDSEASGASDTWVAPTDGADPPDDTSDSVAKIPDTPADGGSPPDDTESPPEVEDGGGWEVDVGACCRVSDSGAACRQRSPADCPSYAEGVRFLPQRYCGSRFEDIPCCIDGECKILSATECGDRLGTFRNDKCSCETVVCGDAG